MPTRPMIVCDVNETLLDLNSLEPLFADIFGVPGRMREWFGQIILYSEALTLAGRYVPFGDLGGGVLRMLGDIHGVAIEADRVRQLAALIADMPVHADVAAALAVLKDAGFAIVTLTNTPASPGPDPLDRAGLGAVFDRRFSVDAVRCFKPTPATYRLVQDAMAAAPETTWMVAAHTWDTIGAQAFGWKGALITRSVNAPLVLEGVPQPTVVARDFAEAADAIVAAS